MREATESERKSLTYTALSNEQYLEFIGTWPRCFVCGNWAAGTNRTGDAWMCGPHWATSLDEALALKVIVTHGD